MLQGRGCEQGHGDAGFLTDKMGKSSLICQSAKGL